MLRTATAGLHVVRLLAELNFGASRLHSFSIWSPELEVVTVTRGQYGLCTSGNGGDLTSTSFRLVGGRRAECGFKPVGGPGNFCAGQSRTY